jgi:glyoxylase I family protein
LGFTTTIANPIEPIYLERNLFFSSEASTVQRLWNARHVIVYSTMNHKSEPVMADSFQLEDNIMLNVTTGAVHHVTLTVTDVKRSCDFYTSLLGFQAAMELGPKMILSNGKVLLVLAPPPDESQKIIDDVFNENRVGLDHLSLSVANRDELVKAVNGFDGAKVSHGEIRDLGSDLGIYVLAFRDPDNIQIELTAPYA